MESIHTPKKSGAARAGVLAAFLLLALLLALPCACYALYHDQMSASAPVGVRPAMAPTTPPPRAPPLPPATALGAPGACSDLRRIVLRGSAGRVHPSQSLARVRNACILGDRAGLGPVRPRPPIPA